MPLNFMIVDDSPVMRAFIRKTIRLTGLPVGECCEAGDGVEALACLSQRWVDIVLADINMPRMNGQELLCRMEADERLRHIPVIVVSTDSSPRRILSMIELGARGYVSKPFAPQILRDEVERVLGGAHDE